MVTNKIRDLPLRQQAIIRAWCIYDWANSGYSASGIAAIFPVYFVYLFKEALGEATTIWGFPLTGSSTWSFAAAVSAAIVALSGPILGVIADHVPIKKPLLLIYTVGGSLFIMLAFFAVYTPHPWAWLITMFAVANIGFAGSLVFYNSFLPHLGPRNLLDAISSRGYAYGYIGGGLLLLIHLVLIVSFQDTDLADLITRISIASIGLWWMGWAVWTLRIVPEPEIVHQIRGMTPTKALKLAWTQLGKTFGEIAKFRMIVIYLAAYLLFNDGIQTVMGIAGAFAADTLRIPLAFNMATILVIQFVAAFGASVFSRLAELFTTKRALVISLFGWSVIILFGVALAPLAPRDHSSFDYQLSYQEAAGSYKIMETPTIGDSSSDTRWLEEMKSHISGSSVTVGQAGGMLRTVRESPNSWYSLSISGGPLDRSSSIGELHPSVLGDGPLDWWPIAFRNVVWEPLGISSGYQWLILGLFVGLVMGGSQALARSLFAKITPETRSGEFFSFFGFMGRASSVFGPMVYLIMTGMFDTRVALTSILIIIVAGTVGLKWVDVEKGSEVAAMEDSRQRSGPR